MLIQQNLFTYWDIIQGILVLFIVIPFIYIGYLKRLQIPEKNVLYYFPEEYNANNMTNLVKYVEKLETLFGKRFTKFKSFLAHVEEDPADDKRIYIEALDSILFCIKLNGQKRFDVFWKVSDRFLKGMILALPIIGVVIAIISALYFGIAGLILCLSVIVITLHIILIIFSSFLQLSLFVAKKRGKNAPALNLAYFSLDVLINTHVSRAYDNKTETYYYYTTIQKYNNLVNSKFGFSSVYIRSSSLILGDLKELALGDKL